MKVVWVLMNSEDKWLELGIGDPVEAGDYLLLFDGDKNIIGRIALADLRGWRAKDVGGPDQ